MNTFKKKTSKKRKQAAFNPSHSYIDLAVKRFLKEGGKIGRESLDYAGFMGIKNPQTLPTDDFLLGIS